LVFVDDRVVFGNGMLVRSGEDDDNDDADSSGGKNTTEVVD
jgi:hypothetical protein